MYVGTYISNCIEKKSHLIKCIMLELELKWQKTATT